MIGKGPSVAAFIRHSFIHFIVHRHAWRGPLVLLVGGNA